MEKKKTNTLILSLSKMQHSQCFDRSQINLGVSKLALKHLKTWEPQEQEDGKLEKQGPPPHAPWPEGAAF